MWHQIRVPGPRLDSALESGRVLRAMSDRLLTEMVQVLRRIVALREAGVQARITEVEVEMYARSERDGAEILYLNDAAFQLYADVGETRPVETTMERRPPDNAERALDREALLLRHPRPSHHL